MERVESKHIEVNGIASADFYLQAAQQVIKIEKIQNNGLDQLMDDARQQINLAVKYLRGWDEGERIFWHEFCARERGECWQCGCKVSKDATCPACSAGQEDSREER